MSDELISRKTLAKKLEILPKTIERYEKRGLPFIWLGNRKLKRYNFDEVISWLKKQQDLDSNTVPRGGEENE